MVQLTINNPTKSTTSEFPLSNRQTITDATINIDAATSPIYLQSHPPAIFPSIATAPSARMMVGFFNVPVENSPPISDLSITISISDKTPKKMKARVNESFLSLVVALAVWVSGDISSFRYVSANRQIAKRMIYSSVHEKNTIPIDSPKAPVETKVPRARISLLVFSTVCFPPHT